MPSPEEIKEVMQKAEKEMDKETKAEFPAMPEKIGDEVVPDKIPPLEGIPEPPEFKAEKTSVVTGSHEEQIHEALHAHQMPTIAAEDHPVYIPPEEPAETKETKRKIRRGPLYIRSDRFKAVLDDIEQIRAKFKEEDDFFFRISDIKNAQDQKFEDFKQTLEDVQRKLLFIDRTLFEAT